MSLRDDATECRSCGALDAVLAFSGQLLSHRVDFFECRTCRYVQTERPFWLEQPYSTVMNDSDTGVMSRNLTNARIVLGTLWMLGALPAKVVDFAGGYGVLVRLLRDYGVDAFWVDRYCTNLMARGFEYDCGQAGLLTAFEALEHFVAPGEELAHMLSIAPTVLLSTELMPVPTPAQQDWWYYGSEHGQHIGFFRVETLRALASRHGKRLLTDGRAYHLVTDHAVNETAWRLMLRLNRAIPALVRGKLTSRTWSDHELMASRPQK